jgi:hypothetical protein
MREKKKRGFNIGSLIGWLIFILAFAGAPLLRLLRQVFSGSGVTLPANINTLIPLAVAGLVVLSIAISAVRAIGSSRRGDDRLPTGTSPPQGGAPMPPFAGPSAPRMPPAAPQPRAFMPPNGGMSKLPTAPRFEPMFNPRVVVFGIVGLVVLGGLLLLVLGLSLP